MKVQLKNQHAVATFYPSRGGLLTDLFLEDARGEPVDIFWKSPNVLEEASGWPMGGMPFLFPFGGRLYHQDQPLRYGLADGREFHMPLHGFAYGLPWHWETQGGGAQMASDTRSPGNPRDTSAQDVHAPSQLCLILEDSPSTQGLFPFRFRVALTYALEPSRLTVQGEIRYLGPLEPSSGVGVGKSPSGSQQVVSPGPSDPKTGTLQNPTVTSSRQEVDPPMPVAPGFHPFFKIPLRRAGRLSECFLESDAQTLVRVTPKGLAGKASAIDPAQRPHPVSGLEFQNSILTDLKDPVVHLVDRDQKMSLEMGWNPQDPFKHLVLWSQPSEQPSPFYCVEPWTALPDALAPGHGAVWLEKGESLSFGLRISLRDQRR